MIDPRLDIPDEATCLSSAPHLSEKRHDSKLISNQPKQLILPQQSNKERTLRAQAAFTSVEARETHSIPQQKAPAKATPVASASIAKLQLSGAQGGSGKSQNLKLRQKTLKDMVFSNLKPGNEHGHIDPLPSINSNTLMQYSKVPPKSPASPTGSDPNGEN